MQFQQRHAVPETVGPGSYDIPSTFSCKSLRNQIHKPYLRTFKLSKGEGGTPGPGSYDIRRNGASSSASFSCSPRILSTVSHPSVTPGPGAYDSRSRSISPAFSFGARLHRLIPSASPGPAHYSAILPGRAPLGTFHNSPRRLSRGVVAVSPGPAAYDVLSSSTSGPAFTMRSRTRGYLPKDDLPGPGAYGGLFSQFD